MKRIGFLLLCVCLSLCFTACDTAPSGQTSEGSQPGDTQNSAGSRTTTAATTSTTTAATSGSEAGQTTTVGGVSMNTTTTTTTTQTSAVTSQTSDAPVATTFRGTTTKKPTTTTTRTTSTTQTTTTRPSYASPLGGLRLSILGDSLSSYDGYSNVGTNNTTVLNSSKPEGMEAFLSSVHQTYWMQVIEEHEMELLVNNSWSGSLMRGSGDSSGAGNRAVNLHANIGPLKGTAPDVIAVFMGTNDLFWSEAGTFTESLPATLITDRGNGTYSYADATDFAKSYVIAMHKITTAYPDAKVFCFTLHPNKGCSTEVVERFNAVIRGVAAYYDAPVVDLYQSELTATDTYLADSLHFNATGMKVVADLFEKALLAEFDK